MSLQACADLLRKGDPDRFLAAMAAPVKARAILLPLYAFNLEIARAPWIASEPMIGEMRLQWWRDALHEIADGQRVRRHEVATPLSQALNPSQAAFLDASVAARRWDLYTDPFEDEAHFHNYLEKTGGNLMWVAAQCLGAHESSEPAIMAIGRATALVRFLMAVPALEDRGRIPLLDGRPGAIKLLVEQALDRLPRGAMRRLVDPATARPALIEGWQTRPLLEQIRRNPAWVSEGRVGLSEFRKRVLLFQAAL